MEFNEKQLRGGTTTETEKKRLIRIVLCGASGRMGRAVLSAAAQDARFQIAAGICLEPVEGLSCAGLDRLPQLLKEADLLIDFSSPQSCVVAVGRAAELRKPAVVGTTGFTKAQRSQLKDAGARSALLVAPNMSPGMNLLFHLAASASAALPGYDAAISETHHSAKKDAPSGSALRLGEAVREARKDGKKVDTVSLRAGDVAGEHTLILAGPGERLELTHRAHSREVFARGALLAASWLLGRKPGLYSMNDVLGL